jgi:hypothetical protein
MKKKPATKKVPKKKAPASRAKKTPAKQAKPRRNQPAAAAETSQKLTFNHAMIYAKDVERSLGFYRDLMGFKLIEDFRY